MRGPTRPAGDVRSVVTRLILDEHGGEVITFLPGDAALPSAAVGVGSVDRATPDLCSEASTTPALDSAPRRLTFPWAHDRRLLAIRRVESPLGTTTVRLLMEQAPLECSRQVGQP